MHIYPVSQIICFACYERGTCIWLTCVQKLNVLFFIITEWPFLFLLYNAALFVLVKKDHKYPSKTALQVYSDVLWDDNMICIYRILLLKHVIIITSAWDINLCGKLKAFSQAFFFYQTLFTMEYNNKLFF